MLDFGFLNEQRKTIFPLYGINQTMRIILFAETSLSCLKLMMVYARWRSGA